MTDRILRRNPLPSDLDKIITGVNMNTTINAVGFVLDQDQNDLINKKLSRIKYAEDLVSTCAIKVKEDKKFYFDASISFRWGASAHIEADDYDFAAALNKLMDVADNKIKKEKDKIQEKN